jgi:hypothetical protein
MLSVEKINIKALHAFAKENPLETKQQLAFKNLCSFFIMSYLNDVTNEISTLHKENIYKQLKSQGAEEQIIMFVTALRVAVARILLYNVVSFFANNYVNLTMYFFQ